MVRATAVIGLVIVGMLLGATIAIAQGRGGAQGANQAAPNPQDEAVKMAGQAMQSNASGQPLDAQKSAPVQVLTRDYDLDKLTHEPEVPETVFRGRVLWVQKCAFCHDGLGQPTYKTMGPWLDQDLVAALTDPATKVIIETGTAHMPAFKFGLTSSQLDDLLDLLKSVPASAKPTPAQLAGRNEGGGSD